MADDNCINYNLSQSFIYLKQNPKIMQGLQNKIEIIKLELSKELFFNDEVIEPSRRVIIFKILELIEKILELLIVLKSK